MIRRCRNRVPVHMGSQRYVSKSDTMLDSIFINLFGWFLALSTRAASSSFREASSRRDSHVASLSVASRSENSTKARVPRAAVFAEARSVIRPYLGRRGCSDQRHWEGR